MRNYKSYSKTLKSASAALLLGFNLSYADFLFSEIDLSEFIADVIGSVNIGQIKADSLKIQERIERNVQNAQPKK